MIDPNWASGPLITNPRFARALSKIRSNNKRKIRSQAKKFLKEAANTKNRMDKRPRENAHWVKHADLNPVFAYLVENGKWTQILSMAAEVAFFVSTHALCCFDALLKAICSLMPKFDPHAKIRSVPSIRRLNKL